jgi:hypothetical protein
LQKTGRLGVVRREDSTVKDLSWQSMALGGALVVAFSAAIPGSHGGGEPCAAAPRAAGFEVEARDDGIVGAVLTLDPDAVVTDLSVWSTDAVFGDPVEVEPGIWVAEAPAHLAGGCYTATVEVVLGGAASEPHTKVKKSKTKKAAHHAKAKSGPGHPAGNGHGDSDHGSKSKRESKKKQCDGKGGASLVLTLTSTGCNVCAPGDDPFTPLPDRS